MPQNDRKDESVMKEQVVKARYVKPQIIQYRVEAIGDMKAQDPFDPNQCANAQAGSKAFNSECKTPCATCCWGITGTGC